ncbi:MAG: DUF1800 family protein [Planctomycetota bacterium]
MLTFKAAGSFGVLAALLLGSTASAAQEAGTPAETVAGRARSGFVWDAKKVEHLMNRAGFGARPSEIEAAVALGQAALVEKLVGERVEVEPFFFERIEAPDPKVVKTMSVDDRTAMMREIREKDRRQLLEYTTWWYDRMTSGEDALRERMVLFWHGFFTSSFEDVKRSWLLIQQNQLVRQQALGSYADLLAAMAKDPAMLTFLDNQVNKKASPNENFARELMELFSLGAGNFTEQDVKEAARALTGRGVSRQGNYEFHKRLHDDGEKTVLGVTDRMNGDDLVKVILAQDACPRWIAGKLLVNFEGVEPSPKRLADYAAFLRANEYRIQPFLRRLFLDPEFYRDEVIGARVQSPVDFMVGFTRRLGVQVPSAVLGSGATLLGQRLFWPPSVKGWEEGESWISTATIMQRGNLAGFMLGLVKVEDVLSEPETREPPPPPVSDEPGMTDGSMGGEESGEPMTERPPMRKDGQPGAKMDKKRIGVDGAALYGLKRAESSGWTISINLSSRIQKSGARTDAEIADRMLDDLLAIDAPQDTRDLVQTFLARERGRLKLADGKLLDAGAEAEHVLRRLAHLIYSLPEAQLG